MTAWKFFTREKALLKKYLKECNFYDSNGSSKENLGSNKATHRNKSEMRYAFQENQTIGNAYQEEGQQKRKPHSTTRRIVH